MRFPPPHVKQNGVLLIELLVVIALVGILAVFVMPSISDLLAKKDIQEASTTISQVIKHARATAKGQNTFIRVHFAKENNAPQISLSTVSNDTPFQRYNLPARIEIADISDFIFTPAGTVTSSINDNSILSSPVIHISSNSTSATPVEISVSSIGQISTASLEP